MGRLTPWGAVVLQARPFTLPMPSSGAGSPASKTTLSLSSLTQGLGSLSVLCLSSHRLCLLGKAWPCPGPASPPVLRLTLPH